MMNQVFKTSWVQINFANWKMMPVFMSRWIVSEVFTLMDVSVVLLERPNVVVLFRHNAGPAQEVHFIKCD